MAKLLNREEDEEKRRRLRRQAPPAESLLWHQLRGRKLGGFKFRRQYGISYYITDFCCTTCRLIVELDGSSHEDEKAVEYDRNRQRHLESLGFFVVRFTNDQVHTNIPVVLENLLLLCEERQGSADVMIKFAK